MGDSRPSRVSTAAAAFLCLAWLGAEAAGGQTTVTCDLANCIRMALERNRNLAVAKIEIEAAEAAVRKEKAARRPDLDLTLTASEIHGEPVGSFSVLGVTEAEIISRSADYEETGSVTVDLSYPLYADGTLLGIDSPTVAVAETQKEREIWASQSAREEVIHGVSEGFFTSLWKREMIGLSEEDVRIARDRLAVIEREVSLNLKPETEAELARAQLSVAEESLASIRRDFEMAQFYLARLVGARSPSEFALDGSRPPAPELPPLEELLDEVRRAHPDIGIQRANADRTRAELAVVRSGRWPSLFLEGSYTYSDDFSPPGSDLYQAHLRLEVPLADFGERRASVVESELRLRAEEERIQAVEDALVDQLVQTYSEIKTSEGALAVLRKESARAEVDLKFARARQNQGLTGPLAVLDSESRLLSVRKSTAEADYNLFLSLAELQKAAGGAWKWMP